MLPVYIFLLIHVANAFNYQIFYDINDAQIHFKLFMTAYNKTYQSDEEKAERFEIFKKNLFEINELNKKAQSEVHAINQFTDMTSEEFLMKQTGLSEFGNSGFCNTITEGDLKNDAPAQFDWRDHIYMEVKNQLDCTACWAFAATANVEAQYAIKYQTTMLFSEQQIVDCASKNGCGDGIPAQAFRYLIQVGGQEPEDVYPYANKEEQCKFSPGRARVRVNDCVSFSLADEESIKQALFQYGPLATGIDSTTLMTYNSGILPFCTFTKLNHAVLIVGYGTDFDGIDFWVIKNSWGILWGEHGYARIPRGVNACGLHNLYLASSIIA